MTLKTKTNNQLVALVGILKKKASEENVNLWKRIALELEKPTRLRRAVNLYKIDKYVMDKETALVPGKVLGTGDLNKNVTVAAYSFSSQAKDKINKVGKAITISELLKENPKGNRVRIVG